MVINKNVRKGVVEEGTLEVVQVEGAVVVELVHVIHHVITGTTFLMLDPLQSKPGITLFHGKVLQLQTVLILISQVMKIGTSFLQQMTGQRKNTLVVWLIRKFLRQAWQWHRKLKQIWMLANQMLCHR